MISYQCKGKGKGCSWESRAGTCSRDLQCLQLREPLVKYPQHRTIHCLHGMMDPRRRLFSISCALPPTSPVRHMCQQSSASPPSTKTAPHVHAGGLLPRESAGGGEGETGAGQLRAVQNRVIG